MPDLNLKKIQSNYNGQTPSTGKEVEDAFNQNFETVENAINKYDALDLNMFTGSGYINKNTGEVTSGSSYVNTGFMPVINATDIVLTGFDGANGGAQALCAFYNKYKTFISVYTAGTAGDTTVTIPANSFPAEAYYIRCTARAAQATRSVKISFASVIQAIADSAAAFSSTFYNVTQNNPLPVGQYYNFETARTAIPKDLRQSGLVITYAESAKKWITLQFQGTTMNEYAGNFAWYQVPDIRLTGQCMFIHQGYSNRFTGEFVNDSTYIRTVPIPLEGLSSFSFIGTNGVAAISLSGACNFFDKDMNFLGTYTTGVTGNISGTVLKSDYPDNAAFAIVSASKTDRYQTDFVLGNFGESIVGILKLIKELDASVNTSLSEIADALDTLDTTLRTIINAVATDLDTTKQIITAMGQTLGNVGETAAVAYNLANQVNQSVLDLSGEFEETKEAVSEIKDSKADNGFFEDGHLYLTANGVIVSDPIEIAGGGGSGGGSVARLINQGPSSIGVAKGETVLFRYLFTSVDTESEEPTGDGTAAYHVNGIRVATRNIHQGENTFDATPYLAEGVNTVRVQVTDSYGAVRQLNIGVTVANISLTSTFNADVPYSSAISFPFTPVGSGMKTVHFILDGEELAPLTTTATNRQLTYALPPMTHGAHPLRVYATLEVGGVTLTSEVLNFDIVCLEAGNSDVIIASVFDRTEATQYDTLAIRYIVYNPASQTTAVTLSANGSEVASLLVDRTPHTWSYRIPQAGALLLAMEAGNALRQFSLDVQASPIDSEAETEALELHLTSGGRSNNELNPGEWKYNGIEAALTGFNYITNGWVLDDHNITVLRVSAGASVTIPFKPFLTDFRGTGKTVEFEFATRDVENYNAVLVSCMSGNRGFQITAQQVVFRSELSRMETMYKDNEHVRISFVIETMLQNRLIYTYINGIKSGVVQYPVSDNFAQNSPVNITVGSPECTVDIYNIRVYASPLNDYQILNNFIVDTADVTQKLALYDRNRVYDSSGDIVYSLILPQIPCMTVVGDLPTFKGDKKTVQIIFENMQSPDKSFTSENVQIDVQGTSSQYYPRKNFKTKHNSGFNLTENGEVVSKYKIHDDNIAGRVLCEKTDYAESSGTHNTGLARFINDLLKAMDIKTPPQIADEKVRTTVDGYPVVMFHRAGPAAPIEFVGKYNMNYDKDSQEVFGFYAK